MQYFNSPKQSQSTNYKSTGGATLTIPVSKLTIPKGVTTTININQPDKWYTWLIIGLSSTVTSSQDTAPIQNTKVEQPITIRYNPESLIVDFIINSSMQVTVNNNLPADTYNINIFASYIANNGNLMHIQVGTMSLSYAGGTPTPDPTPSPNPTPTPSPTPLAGILTITPESLTLIPNQQGNLTLTLNNSAEINNLVVSVASESTGIDSINSTSCTLSTTDNICTLNITGINFDNTTITASAVGYQPAVSSIDIRNLWSQVGGNVTSAGYFYSIIQNESSTYASGYSLATPNTAGVWIWNGSSWSQLGNKITSANLFSSIIQDNAGNIYVGGSSSSSRGGVWKWNGSTWTQLESSISSVKTFNSLTQDESGNIYAGGMTTGFNSLAVVWKWNGSSWSQLGSNVTSARNFTSILRDRIGNIYAGGATTSTVYGGLWVYTP